MENKTAAFELRWAAGHKRAYPVNLNALHLCEMLGSKTMPMSKMTLIGRLGFEVSITDMTVQAS